ncbi:hypothetical protein SAMN05421820_104220 [Pedobacter steynii]|uniref:Protochlamydia outer membrane protein domain-containing protein n=1 Tax=Pedobacter steynii TaxID=430522 RepID=A0A1G9UMU0_9SPHI|nr:hypothetical protein SAMN05421820_104220 [Pedobacter steynii]
MVFSAFYAYPQSPSWRITASVAHFEHDYNWSIAGNADGGPPNILSELVWTKMRGPKFNIGISRRLFGRLELGANFSLHHIKKGSVTDTDYLQNNRQDPFFNLEGMANKGSLYDYSLQLKYGFPIGSSLNLKPYLGIAYSDRKLYILDLPDHESDPPLNSSYKNTWKGGIAGAEINCQLKRFLFGLNIEAGYYRYLAKAQWNLNEMFRQPLSFKQTANGYSLSAGLSTSYKLSKSISISIGLEKKYGATWKGIDEAYLNQGGSLKTRFNGAEFNALAAKTGIELTF